MEKSENICSYEDPLTKYENIDASKNALELNIFQVAYLHKLLEGTNFRFQPEENAKKKIQTLKKNLSKKRSAKSLNTDSVFSGSDRNSVSERNVSTPKPVMQKRPSPPKPTVKAVNKIPDNLKLSYQRLQEAKQEAHKRLTNIVREIDFESLEKGVTQGFLTTPEEFESTARQIFTPVLKKYENMSPIHKALSNLLKLCTVTEERKVETEQPKLKPLSTNLSQQPVGVSQAPPMPQQSQSSYPENQGVAASSSEQEVPQLTKEEKKLLGSKIRKLPQKYMKGIIKIVSSGQQPKDGTLEFDINKLPALTNRKLEQYVNDCYNQIAEEERRNAASGANNGSHGLFSTK